jgi:hypothetical protein
LEPRLSEGLEDIFIRALDYEEPGEPPGNVRYRSNLTGAVRENLTQELSRRRAELPLQAPTDPGHSARSPFEELQAHPNFVFLRRLVYIAYKLADPSLGLVVFDQLSSCLFPPCSIELLPVEAHLLALVTLVTEERIARWWEEWWSCAEGVHQASPALRQACRTRLPIVIHGLLTSRPETAVQCFWKAVRMIPREHKERFLSDFVDGLLARSDEKLIRAFRQHLQEERPLGTNQATLLGLIHAIEGLQYASPDVTTERLRSELRDGIEKALCQQFVPIPPFQGEWIGYGASYREVPRELIEVLTPGTVFGDQRYECMLQPVPDTKRLIAACRPRNGT